MITNDHTPHLHAQRPEQATQWTAARIQECVDPGKQPTPEQIAVIEGPLRPTLVVAGAGAGKTETMSMRVLWLVAHEGIDPERILGLTFTRKAAGELGERLRARLATLSTHLDGLHAMGDPSVTTYNSFAQRIVKEHGWRIGVSPDTRLLGGAASVQLMSDIVREQPIESLPKGSIATIVKDCRGLAQTLAEHRYTPATVRGALKEFAAEIETQALNKKGELYGDAKTVLGALEKRETYLTIIEQFDARKRHMGVIDFADQLALATRLVTEFPDVVHAIRSEYDAVLLDEFQDTSVIQMVLFSELFGSHHGHPLAVTAVGDPHQAIYGWRGASAASLENFIEYFDRSQTQLTEREQQIKSQHNTLTLSTAWRNDRQILAAANVVAAPLQSHARRVKVQPLKPRPQAGVGTVNYHYALTPEAQADYIATEYAKILDNWRAECQKTPSGQQKPEQPTMAVLAKRRKDFPLYDKALRAKGIPTQVFDSGGLLTHPTIVRLRAALSASSDIEDPQALITLVDELRLGAADMALLWQWAKHLASMHKRRPESPILIEAIDTPPPVGWQPEEEGPSFTQAAHDRVALLGQRLRVIRNVSPQGLLEQVERAIRVMGLVEDALSDHIISDGRAVLDAFIDVAMNYANENEWAEINGFLAWLEIAQVEERGLPAPQKEPEPGAVHVMTVHGSKGLEWDVVSVVGMGDAAFPEHDSTSKTRELIRKEDRYEVNPNNIWSASAWLTKTSELPYDLRGDRSVLPVFDYTLFEGTQDENGKDYTFRKWFQDYYKTEVGRHLEREQRRLAYVALTRAKKVLYLTGDWLDGTSKGRHPSIYLMETLSSLILEGENAANITDPDSWVTHCDEATISSHIARWKDTWQTMTQSEEHIELAKEQQEKVTTESAVIYPRPSTPEQIQIEQVSEQILRRAKELEGIEDLPQILEHVGEEDMLRHALAVIAQHRRQHEVQRQEIPLTTLRATAVSSLLADSNEFALHMRRPLPAQPSASASLGTLIHAWVERQLRQTTPELWSQPVEGIEHLSDTETQRFQRMCDNFNAWTPPGKVQALEENFAVKVAGVHIQGRIDAIFTDNDKDIIIDWKSGRVPQPTDYDKLLYFRDQLRLYQHAWAQRTGVEPGSICAQLYFLEHNVELTVDTIEEWINDYRAQHYTQVSTGHATFIEALEETLG